MQVTASPFCSKEKPHRARDWALFRKHLIILIDSPTHSAGFGRLDGQVWLLDFNNGPSACLGKRLGPLFPSHMQVRRGGKSPTDGQFGDHPGRITRGALENCFMPCGPGFVVNGIQVGLHLPADRYRQMADRW